MTTSAATTERKAVLAADDEWVRAELARDEAALSALLHDRFVFNSSRGETTGKTEFIEHVFGANMTAQTLTERSVVVEGDTAVVCGTAEVTFESRGSQDSGGPPGSGVPGGPEVTVALLRYSATYVKRDGAWRALALQMAKRTPKEPSAA